VVACDQLLLAALVLAWSIRFNNSSVITAGNAQVNQSPAAVEAFVSNLNQRKPRSGRQIIRLHNIRFITRLSSAIIRITSVSSTLDLHAHSSRSPIMSNHKRDRRLPKKAFIEERVIGLWNLSYAATHAQVEQVVADHGFKDATFHWARLRARDISRGWLHCGTCSVMFADKETAENAKAALCGVLFDGKAIKVQTKVGHNSSPLLPCLIDSIISN
jgi:hypothetical protein